MEAYFGTAGLSGVSRVDLLEDSFPLHLLHFLFVQVIQAGVATTKQQHQALPFDPWKQKGFDQVVS